MEIYIVLQSDVWEDEKNKEMMINPISIEWDLPFLPSSGDVFDVNGILNMNSDCFWTADYVSFDKEKGKIIPFVYLIGV